MTPRTRFVLWSLCVALLVVGIPTWIFLLRGERILENDPILIGGWIFFSVVLIGLAALLHSTPPNAIKLKPSTSIAIILGGAAIFHACAITFTRPLLSDDAIRYRWDAKLWLAKVSPYSVPPMKWMERTLSPHHTGEVRLDPLDIRVTFPQMHTIYPPTAQAVFVGCRVIERMFEGADVSGKFVGALRIDQPAKNGWRESYAELPADFRMTAWRVIFSLAAIATSALLISATIKLGRSPWYATLFAWHPLTIIETGAMIHQDIFGVLLIVLAIRLYQDGRLQLALVALALAAGIKPHAAMLAPFFLTELLRQRMFVSAFTRGVLFVFVTVLIYAPIWIDTSALAGWATSLRVYARHWEANGSLFPAFAWIFGQGREGVAMNEAKLGFRHIGSIITAIALVILIHRQFRRSTSNRVLASEIALAGYVLFLITLAFSAVVYPWYLLWFLAMIPLLPAGMGWTGLTFAASSSLCYLLWHGPIWKMPVSWLLVEYVPVYVVGFIEWRRAKRRALAPDIVR